ncbi:MAG: putative toxin-antitoxin system toxin component, PIN family [Rhodothermales bacterium]|nr:putative toxin-antitoxin system toxin component, PIN family [Rhodothermales bacterium]
MRVFLDTNVLVSAFATRGLCADVLRVVLSEHELVTSDDVLDEFHRTLEKKFAVPTRTVAEILTMLRAFDVEARPSDFTPLGLPDEFDEYIVAAARASSSDVLITGDKELLALAGEVDTVRILSPRGFWDFVGQGK